MAAVGIIEPLVVARSKDRAGRYLLLDGHLRHAVLIESGATEVRCLIAKDDEAFTYNKRINRLATIQEHLMIVRAIDRGVSEDAGQGAESRRPGNRRRRTMLVGISPEVVDLLKDKSVNPTTFEVLRKMKPMRQIEAAELMNTAGNYTSSYAKALLAATRQADLVKVGPAEEGRRPHGRTDGSDGARDGDAAAGREERRVALRRRCAHLVIAAAYVQQARRQRRHQSIPRPESPGAARRALSRSSLRRR